jgi:hypothetical protein
MKGAYSTLSFGQAQARGEKLTVQVDGTRMTLITRIDADLFGLYPR